MSHLFFGGDMIYCYKKLRELGLTHIFFLCYSIAVLLGAAAIVLLFLLGGGLQIYSVMVLCIMYTQPTIYLLRRMDIYRVRHEIKREDYNLGEKINFAIEASVLTPVIDTDFIFNMAVLATCFMEFWFTNLALGVLDNPFIIWAATVVNSALAALLWLDIIQSLKEKDME